MIYDNLIETLNLQHALLVELIGITSLRIERDGDHSGIDSVNLDLYQKQAIEVEAKIKRAEQMDLTYGKLLQRQADIGASIIALDFRILNARIAGTDASDLVDRKHQLYDEFRLVYNEIEKFDAAQFN